MRLLVATLTVIPLTALVAVVPLALSASASTVPAPPPGWTTVFSDSFSGAAGSHADSQWTYDTGTQYNGTGCTANWGTGEVENNTNSTANVSEDGSGHLNITPVNSGGSWTSVPPSGSRTRPTALATGRRSGCSGPVSGPAARALPAR